MHNTGGTYIVKNQNDIGDNTSTPKGTTRKEELDYIWTTLKEATSIVFEHWRDYFIKSKYK